MFMELGMKIDDLLDCIRMWNTQRIWYKVYGHFYIKKKIKTKAFKNYQSFQYFMNMVKGNNQIWDWQYKLFYKMYKGE